MLAPFIHAVIETLDLREIEMKGRQYTWANDLDPPTFEKLDRVLMSTDWEGKYPMVSVEAMDRARSDHTPLLLNTGASSQFGSQPPFRFELGWLIREGFYEMVANIWQKDHRGNNAIEI